MLLRSTFRYIPLIAERRIWTCLAWLTKKYLRRAKVTTGTAVNDK